MRNLNAVPLPIALLYQYLPGQAKKIAFGLLENDPEAIFIDHIGDWIDNYLYATGQLIWN